MKQAPAALGTAMEGGFFSGIINVNGSHKAIITAPKSSQIRAELFPRGQKIKGDFSPCDCALNMKSLLAAKSKAAEQIADTEINGYKDWLIPSRDVLEIEYRSFKPTKTKNYCGFRDGENAHSIPPTYLYLPDNPLQTTVDQFKDGGAEAFDPAWYWSSTVLPDGDTAFVQSFGLGTQLCDDLLNNCLCRAVRLIQL